MSTAWLALHSPTFATGRPPCGLAKCPGWHATQFACAQTQLYQNNGLSRFSRGLAVQEPKGKTSQQIRGRRSWKHLISTLYVSANSAKALLLLPQAGCSGRYANAVKFMEYHVSAQTPKIHQLQLHSGKCKSYTITIVPPRSIPSNLPHKRQQMLFAHWTSTASNN